MNAEFFTYDDQDNEIPIQQGDLLVSSAGITLNARVIRLEPAVHYGARLDIEPEIIDPMEVIVKRKRRSSETETQSELGGFDLAAQLPTAEEYLPPVVVTAQQGNINTQVVRPTYGGNSPNSDGYVLMQSSRETAFNFFKVYYQSLQTGGGQ